MSKTTLQWLFRVGVGAAAAMLDALNQYIGQDVEFSEIGVGPVLAGLVVTALTWGIGKLTGLMRTAP